MTNEGLKGHRQWKDDLWLEQQRILHSLIYLKNYVLSAHNTQLEKKIGEKMDMVPILNQVPHNPAHLLNTTHESGPDAAKDTASKELRVY